MRLPYNKDPWQPLDLDICFMLLSLHTHYILLDERLDPAILWDIEQESALRVARDIGQLCCSFWKVPLIPEVAHADSTQSLGRDGEMMVHI
jgi:hypothetical protein